MNDTKRRTEDRAPSHRVELAIVYRDRKDLPYDEALQKLKERSDIYTIFSVVGLVRDISQKGLGIKFEGQQLMAKNMLQPGENYILKLSLEPPEIPQDMRDYLKREGNYHFLLVKAVCRWARTAGKVSTAGFELSDANDPDVVDFVMHHFGVESD